MRPSYEPCTEVRPSPNKGQGTFATRLIPKHTLVLIDDPIVSITGNDGITDMSDKCKALSPENRAIFDALCTPSDFDDSKYTARLRELNVPEAEFEQCLYVAARLMANGFSVGSQGEATLDGDHISDERLVKRGIFPTMARINHSCAPNVHVHYRENWDAQVLYSLRDIAPGEELFISYFKMIDPKRIRQKRSQDWGFTCTCDVCTPGPVSDEHEELMSQINVAGRLATHTMEVVHGNAAGNIDRSIEECIPKMRRTIALVEEKPHLTPALPVLYNMLGTVETMSGKSKAMDRHSIECFKQCVHYERKLTGKDSPTAKRYTEQLKARQELQRSIETDSRR